MTSAPLSKSSFLKFLQCKEYFWFDTNKPDVLIEKEISDFEKALAEQGKKVEQVFYRRYPGLSIVSVKGPPAVEETNQMLKEGAIHIAQAAFEAGGFFAQSDMVHFKPDGHMDIYEVKSSSSMQNMGQEDTAQAPSKEDHIQDLAFQYEVATRAGYTMDKAWLVELNKTYVHRKDANPDELLTMSDVTSDVKNILTATREKMQEALDFSKVPEAPVTCGCKYKPRNKQCPAFAFLHPEWTAYSVYDLARIGLSPKRLKDLVDRNYIRIGEIPPGYKLLDGHRDQVMSWNENREIIQLEQIGKTLNALSYPLYFLDYETYAPAIPVFEGTRPYQHIPFQYSLHIIPEYGAEVIHKEYLHPDSSSPMAPISHHLRADITDHGTIIVWNKTFESKCHENLSNAVPGLSTFLMGLNRRMFDLMDIFSKRMYVHKEFRGSASIKKVLPVLVPDLSYQNLEIGDGGKATTEWGRMVFELTAETEKEPLRRQLKEYCRLDTLAMVEIWKYLKLKVGIFEK